MTFSVLGFSQRRLVELGLTMDEAMVLRWFVDYQSSGRMRTIQFSGYSWYWVNFSGVLESLPIIGGSAKTVSRRFEKLEAAGVMEHYTFREGGVFSCFRINAVVYESLIDDIQEQRKQVMAVADSVTPTLFPLDQPEPQIPVFEGKTNEEGGETELSNGETELSNRWTNLSEQKTRVLNQSIKLKEKPPVSPTGGIDGTKSSKPRFKKPTIEEIAAFCNERKNGIDAEEFFYANESKGWLVGTNRTPMIDWKATIITWERKRKQNNPGKKRANSGWEGQQTGRVRL